MQGLTHRIMKNDCQWQRPSSRYDEGAHSSVSWACLFLSGGKISQGGRIETQGHLESGSLTFSSSTKYASWKADPLHPSSLYFPNQERNISKALLTFLGRLAAVSVQLLRGIPSCFAFSCPLTLQTGLGCYSWNTYYSFLSPTVCILYLIL